MKNDIDELYRIVQEKFDVTEEEIKSPLRVRGLVDMRRIMTIVLLKNTRMNLDEIGEAIGRDHSNISHYKKTTEGLFETEAKLRKAFMYVNMRFKVVTDGRTLEEKLGDLEERRDMIEEEIVETKEAIKEIELI